MNLHKAGAQPRQFYVFYFIWWTAAFSIGCGRDSAQQQHMQCLNGWLAVFDGVLASRRGGPNSIPGRDKSVLGLLVKMTSVKALMRQYFRNKLSALTSHTYQCIVGLSSNTFRIILLHRTRWNQIDQITWRAYLRIHAYGNRLHIYFRIWDIFFIPEIKHDLYTRGH